MLLSHAPGIIHDYLFQFFSRKSIVFNSKSNNKLITSSTSFYLHYPWQHFLEMVDVAVTLVSINRTPECFNSVNELLFWSWLYFPNVLFQLVPHILYGVSIRWLSRCAPPVDLVLSDEVLSLPRCMLRIVVLHEPVAVWELPLNERHQCFLEDFTE